MDKIVKQILEGKIFIYPTDTIYGIGCDATNVKAVKKIKKIKERDGKKPLSIIAPSIDWIKKNCIIDIDLEKYLPGPYTLILEKKDQNFLHHVSSTNMFGVRIPKCKFSKKVKESEVPFITTSVNISGEPFSKSIKEISKDILNNVDVIIDWGKLDGSPSIIISKGKEIRR